MEKLTAADLEALENPEKHSHRPMSWEQINAARKFLADNPPSADIEATLAKATGAAS